MSVGALAGPTRADAEKLETALLESLSRSAAALAESSALVADWRAMQGWQLLGFATVADWARERCGKSRRSVFRMLDQAEVVESLNAALPKGSSVIFASGRTASMQSAARGTLHGESPAQGQDEGEIARSQTIVEVTQREAQRVKPKLQTMTRRISHGAEPEKEFRAAARPEPKAARLLPVGEQLAFVFDEAETVLAMATELTPENFGLLRDALARLLEVVRQGAEPARADPPKPSPDRAEPFRPRAVAAPSAPVRPMQPVHAENRRPNCPKGCMEPVIQRFGRWMCRKHG